MATAGQPQGMSPSVVRVGAPFEEPAALQFIDDPDDPAGWHCERRRQRGLCSPLLGGDMPQDEHRPGVEADRRETLLPAPRRVRAELREQVRGARHAKTLWRAAVSRLIVRAHVLAPSPSPRRANPLQSDMITICNNTR